MTGVKRTGTNKCLYYNPAIWMNPTLRTSDTQCGYVGPSERFHQDLQIALQNWEDEDGLSVQMVKIAQIVEMGGAAAVVAGVILSVHHYAIGICFVAGIAALATGYKLRQS
jgi:hypothetical protein